MCDLMMFESIGFTLDLIGKTLIAISVFLVHNRVMQERKIDRKIIKEMKRERSLVLIGIILMIVGYLLQLPTKLPSG